MPDFEELGEFLAPEREPSEPLPLGFGSELETEPSEPAELGFEPDGRYRGFRIVPRSEIELDLPEVHSAYPDSFYICSLRGLLGFVPWPGSVVVWPWEAAWVQDMRRDKVQSVLRPVEQRKRK